MEQERRTFMATVLGNSLQKSSNKGTASVAIRCRTLFDVEEPETPFHINVIGNLWLTYKCMGQTIKSLQEAFDWKGTNITDFNEPILCGKRCQIVCEEEEYNDEMRWKIQFFNRAGGLKKMAGPELADLVADVQPMINEMLGVESRATVEDDRDPGPAEEDAKFTPVEENNPAIIEDDLPF